MPRAEEFQQVSDHVFFWQAYDPSVKADLSCCAVRTGEGLVLIDPIALAPDALSELTETAAPVAILLTNGNHARAAHDYAKRFAVPVLAHPEAAPELGIPDIRPVAEGDAIAGELRVIALPGGGAGEIAVHSPRGSLHVGDALIHVEPLGFTFLPEKYCRDSKTLRSSTQKLLPFGFDVLTFAHGTPLVSRAHDRLAQLLAS
jgi:hypothetical protein